MPGKLARNGSDNDVAMLATATTLRCRLLPFIRMQVVGNVGFALAATDPFTFSDFQGAFYLLTLQRYLADQHLLHDFTAFQRDFRQGEVGTPVAQGAL
jgi:hypothetical protein